MLVVPAALRSCHCCGLIQRLPIPQEPGWSGSARPRLMCPRCRSRLPIDRFSQRSNQPASALALTALILFPVAITLPFLTIQRLGHTSENSLLGGVQTLFEDGHGLIGLIVLLFSIVFPPLKLTALLILGLAGDSLRHHHRALTYRLIEQLGRWGMLDVLFVALLIIFVKIGDLVDFSAGSGVYAFSAFVLLSLVASGLFNPHCLWEEKVVNSESGSEPVPGSESSVSSPSSGNTTIPWSEVSRRSKLRWLWLLPIVSLIGTILLTASNWSDSGTSVRIHFTQGHGLKPGDLLNHRGIAAGKVEKVVLTDDLGGVDVEVRLTPEARRLACVGSKFWIIRPRINLTNIGGLETVVGAKYLAVMPGNDPNQTETTFVGLEEPPLEDLQEPGGLEIVLQANQPDGLGPGTPVYYRQIRIGGVSRIALSSDRSAVEARVYIKPEYRSLIREQTKFWNDRGIRLTGGLTGFQLQIGALETLMRAGITMGIPPMAGDTVHEGHRFPLHNHPEEEWLKWKPSLGEVSQTRTLFPRPQRAILRWTKSGLFRNSQKEHAGWVLAIDGGLIGPNNMLSPPADAKENSTVLILADRSISITAKPEPRGDRLAFLAQANLENPWSTNQIRAAEIPEDCQILSASDRQPVFVSAARFSQEGQTWKIDADLPIDPSWNGAVLTANKDGAVVGMIVIIEKNQPFVALWRPQ